MKTTTSLLIPALLIAAMTTLACRDDGPGYASSTTATPNNSSSGETGGGGDDIDAGTPDATMRPDTRSPGRLDVPPEEDAPEPEDVPPVDTGGDFLDTETVEDIVEDVVEDVPTPDGPPPKVCALARARVASCYESTHNVEVFDEPCTAGAQRCMAECMAGVSCAGAHCSFDDSTDCDGIGTYGMCTQRCNTCLDDGQCIATFDCCGGGWSCTNTTNTPITCDLDCAPGGEPPSCGCEDGVCGGAPERAVTICEDALDRVEACGYTLGDDGDPGTVNRAELLEMRDGVCDLSNACYAGCVAYAHEDPCLECHLGRQLCNRDPVQECLDDCDGVAEVLLCDSTGGEWRGSSCECCGGAARCGDDPALSCLDPCCGPPQCACPDDAPFWSDTLGCIDAGQCE